MTSCSRAIGVFLVFIAWATILSLSARTHNDRPERYPECSVETGWNGECRIADSPPRLDEIRSEDCLELAKDYVRGMPHELISVETVRYSCREFIEGFQEIRDSECEIVRVNTTPKSHSIDSSIEPNFIEFVFCQGLNTKTKLIEGKSRDE